MERKEFGRFLFCRPSKPGRVLVTAMLPDGREQDYHLSPHEARELGCALISAATETESDRDADTAEAVGMEAKAYKGRW